MKAEIIKLGLIDRLMRIRDTTALVKLEKLVVQAEMESRAAESLKAIQQGDILSLDEFRNDNKQWLKKKYTK